MALRDHFLPEDRDMVDDEVENLRITCNKILDNAVSANFKNNRGSLEDINNSMLTLKALNAKKIEEEKSDIASEKRRDWY
ncbi:hypothetical protein M948_18070 [Virgibacillus sp. CM-4]|uniref:hypothetical protein n=1 Tax=Virgibacillus sp. CM-4 TaxID=1354277 RepID=UPI000388627F|nr:hypothetical protein [Virgibacillus sp. CM-4]EQB35012.1 hypothetical protein M948_18070 [Virgibacillus sp. CM-4]